MARWPSWAGLKEPPRRPIRNPAKAIVARGEGWIIYISVIYEISGLGNPVFILAQPKAIYYNQEVKNFPSTPYRDLIRAAQKDGDAGVVTPHTNIAVKPKPVTKKPSMYKVLLLNDDYTPMEFVVQVLETFFNKSREE